MTPHVERCIRRWSRGDEDVAQTARLAAWEASTSGAYRPELGPLEPFLVRVVRNRIWNEWRRRRTPVRAGVAYVSLDEDAHAGSWPLDRVSFRQQYPWVCGGGGQ